MRGKKVGVSAAEMMEMRREGLSNADIAELLEFLAWLGREKCQTEEDDDAE